MRGIQHCIQIRNAGFINNDPYLWQNKIEIIEMKGFGECKSELGKSNINKSWRRGSTCKNMRLNKALIGKDSKVGGGGQEQRIEVNQGH